jgi:hypothetical protein
MLIALQRMLITSVRTLESDINKLVETSVASFKSLPATPSAPIGTLHLLIDRLSQSIADIVLYEQGHETELESLQSDLHTKVLASRYDFVPFNRADDKELGQWYASVKSLEWPMPAANRVYLDEVMQMITA